MVGRKKDRSSKKAMVKKAMVKKAAAKQLKVHTSREYINDSDEEEHSLIEGDETD